MDQRATELDGLVAGRAIGVTETGLHVVMDRAPQHLSGTWKESLLGLSLPADPPPSYLGQIVVVPDQEELGLQAMSDDEIRELLAEVPAASALVWIARRTLLLWDSDFSFEAQMKMVELIFGGNPVLVDKCREFLLHPDEGERRAAFSEQHLHILARFAMESCSATAPDSWNEKFEERLRRALIAVTAISGREAGRLTGEAETPQDWLAYFTQNGAYYAKEQPLLAYQRAWRVFVELSESDEAKDHKAYVDLNALSLDAYGVTIPESIAVAMGVTTNARVRDPSAADSDAVAPPLEAYLQSTALAARHQQFTAKLVGGREFYVDAFKRSRNSESRMATDITPFQQRPFFELPDGMLLLMSPRFADSWLSDGVYYRLLDAASAAGIRDDFTTFTGWLYERYVFEVFDAALPAAEAGEGRVHPDIEYGGELTSDVAIDYGEDLVLVEVVSTMLPLGVRAEADETELEKFMDRAILGKLGQLDRVVDDLRSGKASIPGVDMEKVVRVWPVLVNVGDVTEGEALSSFIEERASELFSQEGTQPLTMLGIDDAEVFAGLVGAGESAVDILRAKIDDGFQQLGFDRWYGDRRGSNPPRLQVLQDRWKAIVDQLVALLKVPE